MAYQALYRQWRPRDFSHVVGQEAIISTLRNQVMTGRIAHAYLFTGSRGTGKTSTARIMATAINCEHPRNGDPCGECESCRRLEAEESLDIIEMDAASNSRVENAREMIETVKYPPQFGRYKVYIIDEVHMLSAAAFNALLKTLEEPPEHVVFILATTDPQKLPATILSRCQRFDFGRIPASKIQGRLLEAVQGAGGTATGGALAAIARAAEGGMRDALSLLDMCLGYSKELTEELVHSVLGTSDRSFLFRFSAALAEQDAWAAIRLVDELMRGGKECMVFAKDMSAHVRALLTAKTCGKEIADILEITAEDAEEYLRESDKFTATRLMDILDLFMRLETDLRYTPSPRIALENITLKCCLRTEAADAKALNDRISELENALALLKDQIAAGAAAAVPAAAAEKKTVAGEKKQKQTEVSGKPQQKTLTPTGRSADESWQEMIRILKKTHPGIGTQLQGLGTYLGSPDGVLFQWQAAPGYEKIAEALNLEKNKSVIEAALKEAAGAESRFIATDLREKKKQAEENNDEACIRSLRSVFGQEPVQVVEGK